VIFKYFSKSYPKHGRPGEVLVVLRGFEPSTNGDISSSNFLFLFIRQAGGFS
jgi:hypothetical protein